ncbi:hypothetical protein GA0070609_5189 [Micromonospora echinaurantiaca]|uniref:Mce-associated membrane protein n=1 Tax=Micromonospora echinaurantiaca TaxID=47857 RepID=A0A1C5K098_9ACTN|nr:hypothetical protein [Micromonospora echinaurantiaca]SCG75949.1 hypothetical protein GA0070609_5189 [Micromonospora echinaurantiaca]
MLLALAVILCGGVVAIPASWAVRKQVEAERGESSPEAAVAVWRLQLSAGEQLGLSRVLAKPRHDELLAQWRDYRAEMTRTGRPPSKIEAVGRSVVEHQGDDRATVVEQIRAVWWQETTILDGTAHPWRWEVRKDRGGWRVWSADLPAWCGVHVRAELCQKERG